jgi:hypothetical protein
MNPYQDLDYMVLQDIYANSIGGRIIDRKEELKFGILILKITYFHWKNSKNSDDETARAFQ